MTDVPGLAYVADSGVLIGVAPADVAGGVGRSVVGNDQLEVLVGLAEQRLDRLREIDLAVEGRQPDTQPRRRAQRRPAFHVSARAPARPGCPPSRKDRSRGAMTSASK